MDELESYYIEQIELLRKEFERAAKPYVDKLVMIRSMRPMQPVIVSMDDLPPLMREALAHKIAEIGKQITGE